MGTFIRQRKWIGPLAFAMATVAVLSCYGWLKAKEKLRGGPASGIRMKMPGSSFAGPLPKLTDEQSAAAKRMQADVTELAGRIGERNTRKYRELVEAAAYVEKQFVAAGYQVERQRFQAKGRECVNLSVEINGTTMPKEIVIVGAHYDSAPGAVGANDNASGVAGVLELARSFAGKKLDRTLRLVAFTNEEQPHFQTESMGSLVYARYCKQQREQVVAMLSLETIGYFSDKPGSQRYPAPFNMFYPSKGNFIGFVGNTASTALVERSVKTFRETSKFPSEGGALPAGVDGVGWSDHWSFWQQGYPALMVTDTAPFRYPYYHTRQDTPDKCDYEAMARIIGGIEQIVEDLVAK